MDLYFSLQNYPVSNPLPYDDTGWTMPLMRNVTVKPITDKSVMSKPMTALDKDAVVPGTVQGTGDVLVVENNTDNVLTTFRFKNPDVKMEAAEQDFTVDGHSLRAGAFIIRNGQDAKVRASIAELGLVAYATSAPTVKTHALTVPRIGYVHSWQRTQDEGWVRAALDHYGEVIVTALMDGSYDKSKLPPQLYLTFYFRIREDRIVTLVILHNKPSPDAA